MTASILSALLDNGGVMTADEIHVVTGVDRETVRAALIQYQDEDRVEMRNGWFRLTRKQRKEMSQ